MRWSRTSPLGVRQTEAGLPIMRYVVLWVRVAFGAHALMSGLNYFVQIMPLPPVDHSAAGPFVAEMTRIGLYDLIKVVELLVGVCLIFNLFTPLALVIEFPITVSIFYLSVVVVGHGRPVFTGWRELFYNGFLIAAYAGYYLPLLTARPAPLAVWSADIARTIPSALRGAGAVRRPT